MSKRVSIPSTLEDFENFLLYSVDFLKGNPAVKKTKKGSVLYVGDIHGYFENIINAVIVGMSKGVTDIVFLGDYTDRGPKQILSLLNVIYAQIAKYIGFKRFDFIDPIFYETSHLNFSILRGNHEDVEINKRYGFRTELQKTYGYFPEETLNNLYDHLPIMAETEHNSFAVHGGIPKTDEDHSALDFLTRIRKIKLPLSNNSKELLNNSTKEKIYQLMWNDPDDKSKSKKPQFNQSYRGGNILTFNEQAYSDFLNETGYKRMIRSHESSRGVYQVIWGGKIIYILSAYPYFDRLVSTAFCLENLDGSAEILDQFGNQIQYINKTEM